MNKLIKGKDDLIRRAKPNLYQPLFSRCTHINRPLQLLVPFEVTHERKQRTPDEKETTSRTDISIEKPVRPRRVTAQNANIL